MDNLGYGFTKKEQPILFGIDGLSPNGDAVILKQPRMSRSPISFPRPLWDQPSSPSSTTPPQHIDNIFGFSSPFSGINNFTPIINNDSLFNPNIIPNDQEDIYNPVDFQRPGRSPSFNSTENASPIIEDIFGMDLIDPERGSETGTSPNYNSTGSSGTEIPLSTYGEHPLGEHPSRTLFVRNINSNVEDEELTVHFEQYGPIRTMYTQCKHRGFVMISYYDIRHAKNAMRNLQGKVLRRRKLDIHYSIPKDNPSEKDQNQGTLVIFNLDPTTTNEELKQAFGVFGEIKEIRETPNKKHHKFIEFYDIRDAEKAMKSLNKTEIKGKKIKIEPSRPGGARKSMMNQMVLEQLSNEDESVNQPQSLPFFPGIDSISDSGIVGYSTNSYPPVQQVLPKYSHGSAPVVLSPPPVYRSNPSSRSHSITSPTDSPPGSNSILPNLPKSSSTWVGTSSHQLDANSRSFSTSPLLENRNRVAGFSPGSSFSTFITDPDLSPTSREARISCESETRKHRSYSIEEDRSKFSLVVNKVRSGEDMRTTLMIKNIPNKYNQKMLLSAVDERHKGTYDFFYLPIDFKNKCNVGYAFINFLQPEYIIPFYEEFNNKKWEKFNSEKVCDLTYARIQGKISLIAHFQNSSLMGEDKKCRPIIFHSEGPNLGEQEPFPVGTGSPRRLPFTTSKEDETKGQ
jgi:RNA recognition motif-containing protein